MKIGNTKCGTEYLDPTEKQCPKCKHFVGCECFDGQTCEEYEEKET